MSHNRKNTNWKLPPDGAISYEQAQLAVLMDIRDELKTMNESMHQATRFLRSVDTITARLDRRARVYQPLTKRRRK